MKLNNFTTQGIAYCEAMGLSRVFEAYADNCSREEIMQVGFNSNSGCVYIALENGISICSTMGQSVDYFINDFDNDDELWFDTYEQALKQPR